MTGKCVGGLYRGGQFRNYARRFEGLTQVENQNEKRHRPKDWSSFRSFANFRCTASTSLLWAIAPNRLTALSYASRALRALPELMQQRYLCEKPGAGWLAITFSAGSIRSSPIYPPTLTHWDPVKAFCGVPRAW